MPKPTNKEPFYSELRVSFLPTWTINSKIETLSELFTEWFLYDSTTANSLESFLENNGLSDIFSVADFTDLICGYAYLDEPTVALVSLLLPFTIPKQKIFILNNNAAKNDVRMLSLSPEIIREMSREVSEAKAKKRKERRRQYRHEHYIANKERINARIRQYALKHAEQIAAYQKQYRQENHETILAYEAEYREKNAEAVSARKKKCYQAKKEEYQAQHKAYYEQHREEIAAQQRAKREKEKVRDESAKSVCPTFLYLLQMRHDHRADFVKLLGQRDMVGFAIKKCPALQEMDASKCVFCDGTENPHEKCAMQQMAKMPSDILDAIPNFVAIIKEKSKTR